jgi:hypothetical protein
MAEQFIELHIPYTMQGLGQALGLYGQAQQRAAFFCRVHILVATPCAITPLPPPDLSAVALRMARAVPEHAAAARTLLASAETARSTYIALAAIVVTIVALSITFCALHRRCCCCQRRDKDAAANVQLRDFDLTSALSGAASLGSLHSVPSNLSAATLMSRMDRAMARERASSASSHGDPDSHSVASPPPSPGSVVTWQDKMQPRIGHFEARQLALGKRLPAHRMGSLQPFRMPPRQGIGRARRPGALPTIPSVTSLGSVGSSFLSDAAYSQGVSGIIERASSYNLTHYIQSVGESVADEGDRVTAVSPPALTPDGEESNAVLSDSEAPAQPPAQASAQATTQAPLNGGDRRHPRSGGRPRSSSVRGRMRQSASLHSLGRSPSVGSSDGEFAAIQEDFVLQIGQDWQQPWAQRPGWGRECGSVGEVLCS